MEKPNKDRMEVLVLSRQGRGRAWPHLGHKEHNQSNVGREHDGQRGKGKGCILLAGENHGDRSSDETQDLERQHLGDSDPTSVQVGCRVSFPKVRVREGELLGNAARVQDDPQL